MRGIQEGERNTAHAYELINPMVIICDSRTPYSLNDMPMHKCDMLDARMHSV
jgi:hypothetical protein